MSNISANEVRDVTETALDAFWATVAKLFPDAKCGDLSPERTVALNDAAEEAVAEWVENNL